MTRALARTVALLLLLVVSLPAAPASAEAWLPTLPTAEPLTKRQEAAVKRSYNAANAAFSRRQWRSALRHAERTFALLPNASTALIRAIILEKLHRERDAFLSYLLAADLAPSDDERALIRAGLGRLGVALDVGWLDVSASPAAATLFVDGTAFSGPRTVGLPSGEHELVVQQDGFTTHREAVTVSAGARTTASVSLVPVAAPTVESLDDDATSGFVPPVVVPDESSTAGWWVLGGGAAVLVAGVIIHVAAVDAASEADAWSAPRAGISAAARKARYDDAVAKKDGLEAATWVCYGLGAAAVATGVVLVLLEGPDAEPAAAHVVPVALRGGGGLSFSSAF
ncbi:MAG: hypothetical protein CVU56_23195 [Deltaproteobacteria bacterium HGW-Deltaproteobacteria-14]|jgi:hypothetical protein|nr:MAG: hypothetical protein CVU56_23195 [Deltaproteobacteria bacterium HGW-Deltaproteobacteria-14]